MDDFASYLAKNPLPFTFDLAGSLFRKDIWSGTTPDTAAVLGVARFNGTCKSTDKIYIMEEVGNFMYTSVATHEIAHT